MKQPPNQKRMIIFVMGLFFLFSLLVAQFFKIQILEGQKWTKLANKQHYMVVKEPFHRGKFYSNSSVKKGHPELPYSFVADIEKFHLYIDPLSIPEPFRKEISTTLIKKLEIPKEQQATFKEQFEKQSHSRKLAMWLDPETNDVIYQWWLPFARKNKIATNAVYSVKDYQRSYPFGKLLGQVLHTIRHQKDELTHQAVPTGGLELYFNQYLKGRDGKRVLMRSPRHQFATGTIIETPEDGADIYLTINHCLQAIAEEELEKGVKKARAKCGWAVMMNPYTGEILALAQYPFFNPLDYQDYFTNPKLIEHTKVKAVTDANEPGSVMKPFILALALDTNNQLKSKMEKPIFDPKEKMDTSNGYFPGRGKPLRDSTFHHYLNMEMALQKSSNIYVARLTERMIQRFGATWFRDRLTSVFGFGLKTNIELPGESVGVLPNPQRKNPNGTPQWSGATPFSVAIGHNIQMNSIQLVRAYSTLANGGYLVKPTLVRKIVKGDTVLVDHTKIEKSNPVLSKDVVQAVVRAMKFVTKEGGTARRANIPGYTEAGKTGTAEKIVNGVYSKQHYNSCFVGFTPVEHPAFVLLVAMDEPEPVYIPGVGKNHHGGTCTAPVFREIASRSLEYLGIPYDNPYGYPVGDPRYDADKADWVAESKRLIDLYKQWNH